MKYELNETPLPPPRQIPKTSNGNPNRIYGFCFCNYYMQSVFIILTKYHFLNLLYMLFIKLFIFDSGSFLRKDCFLEVFL